MACKLILIGLDNINANITNQNAVKEEATICTMNVGKAVPGHVAFVSKKYSTDF